MAEKALKQSSNNELDNEFVKRAVAGAGLGV